MQSPALFGAARGLPGLRVGEAFQGALLLHLRHLDARKAILPPGGLRTEAPPWTQRPSRSPGSQVVSGGRSVMARRTSSSGKLLADMAMRCGTTIPGKPASAANAQPARPRSTNSGVPVGSIAPPASAIALNTSSSGTRSLKPAVSASVRTFFREVVRWRAL